MDWTGGDCTEFRVGGAAAMVDKRWLWMNPSNDDVLFMCDGELL
jgi:hypothetical protein